MAYIRGRLEAGLTLSKLLLDALDLDRGEVFTFLPQGLRKEELNDFSHGGKLPTPPQPQWRLLDGVVMKPIPSAIEALAAIIHTFLAEPGRRSICLLENALARPGEPFLAKLTSRIVIYDQEVYHVLNSADSALERIRQTIREAESLPTFVGALTTHDPDFPIERGVAESFSLGELAAMARRVESTIVGAYDGESYLVWRAQSGKFTAG